MASNRAARLAALNANAPEWAAITHLETVPLVPYAPFGSGGLARGIAAAVANGGKAALLANHGALALGDDLADAARSAELLEFLASVRLGDAQRSAELRQRHLTVIIDGLHSSHPTPLPGRPPTWEEQTARWITR